MANAHLKDMLQNLINDNNSEAEMNIHNAIVAKMRELSAEKSISEGKLPSFKDDYERREFKSGLKDVLEDGIDDSVVESIGNAIDKIIGNTAFKPTSTSIESHNGGGYGRTHEHNVSFTLKYPSNEKAVAALAFLNQSKDKILKACETELDCEYVKEASYFSDDETGISLTRPSGNSIKFNIDVSVTFFKFK